MVRLLTLRTRGSSRARVSALGIAGALFVHALLALPFVFDLSLPAREATGRNGLGASALLSSAEPHMTVVFVNEPAPVSTTPPPKLEALASRGLESLDQPVVVLSSDGSPAAAAAEVADRGETRESVASATDPAEHALLYGRYLGQLQARVERAWLRPRTEIGAPRFSCHVRIRQHRQGAVIDVKVDHCNGTQRWQQSLLSAIRTASPLPAPPDASVYADVLWLSFESEPFEAGGSTQGFEPDTPQLASANDRPGALESFQRFVKGEEGTSRQHGQKDPGVIHLTIIGSPAAPTMLPNNAPTELPAGAGSPDQPPQ